ncbi:MAG: hypothetical protein AAF368_09425, partial [Planctomycetota bacterium]
MRRFPCLLIALLMLSGPAPAQSDFAKLFLSGQAALDRSELARAESDLRNALRLEPASAPCAYALGCVAARRQDADDALARLNHAVDLGYLAADIARWDTDLESLREDSRFRTVLEQMEGKPEGEARYLRPYDGHEQLGIRNMRIGPQAGEVFLLFSDFTLHRFDLKQCRAHPIHLDVPCRPLDAPRISPERRRAMTYQENDAILWALEDNDSWKLLARICRESGTLYSITADTWLSPDETSFACAWTQGNEVAIRRLEDGSLLEQVRFDDHALTSFVWDRDGKTWLAGTSHSHVLVHRVGKTETAVLETPSSLRWRSEGKSPWRSRLALSPDGSQLVVGSGDGGLVVLAYPGFEFLKPLLPFDDWTSIDELHFDSTGERLLASQSTGGTSFVWKTRDWCPLWKAGDLFGNGSLHHSRWDLSETR